MKRLSCRARDDRGSMAMLLLISMVGIMLSSLLVPMIINQDRSTRFTTTRVHALDAARAGIDVALGRIRATAGGGATGNSAALPCTDKEHSPLNAPLTGVVNGAGPASYSVSIEYFTSAPKPMTDPNAPPAMKCISGYGTYDRPADVATPSYARLSSTGKDGPVVNGSADSRTLVATYVFRTTNSNLSGGVLRIYPGVTKLVLCISADADPIIDRAVTLQECKTPLAPEQTFSYRIDLTLQLRSSVTSTLPNGLCLATATGSLNNSVVLKQCAELNINVPYTQQWSFNDSGAYEASTSSSKTTGDLAGRCMTATIQNVGQPIMLLGCENNTKSSTQAWIPSTVGAGGAKDPQLVNSLEFSRCLDVTDQKPGTDHLIAFPCKQNPAPNQVAWNQKFAVPKIAVDQSTATGVITTTVPASFPYPAATYCLTRPATPTVTEFATVKTCVVNALLQRWTVVDGDEGLPYETKFTIRNGAGTDTRCLGLTKPAADEQWSAIVVTACNGLAEQKWNASPDLTKPVLTNIREE